MKWTAGCYGQGRDKQKLRLDCTDLALLTPKETDHGPRLPGPQPSQLSLRKSLTGGTQKFLARGSPDPLEGQGRGTTFRGWAGTGTHTCMHKHTHTHTGHTSLPQLTCELQHTNTHSHTCSYTYTLTHTQAHTVTYSHTHTNISIPLQSLPHAHTSLNIHAHSPADTDTHTITEARLRPGVPYPQALPAANPKTWRDKQGRLKGLSGSLRACS